MQTVRSICWEAKKQINPADIEGEKKVVFFGMEAKATASSVSLILSFHATFIFLF